MGLAGDTLFLLLQVPYKSSDIISNIYHTLLVISFHCLTMLFSLFNFGLHNLGFCIMHYRGLVLFFNFMYPFLLKSLYEAFRNCSLTEMPCIMSPNSNVKQQSWKTI